VELARFLLAVAISAGFSMLVFWHASRYGNPRATAWAVAAFLLVALVVPLYFFSYWYRQRGAR
jgi:predicted PurR-regulated permease PerM